MPPEVLGPYTVVRELGRGGMGVVREVVHQDTGAHLALKTIGASAGPEERLRFQREAEALARLHHPNVVRVHEAFVAGGGLHIVEELLPGGSLAERLARGPLSLPSALRIVAALAGAVLQAHARGLIHRDIKPANVLFDAEERPRLVDFGLALDRSADRLTRTGVVMGTPGYLAPEQAAGDRAQDERVDVHGLGALLFAALTGRPPYEGASVLAALDAVAQRPPPRPSSLRPEVPAEVDDLVVRLLAKRREERPALDALPAELERLAALAEAPRRERGPRPVVAAGALALAVVVVVVLVAGSVRLDGPADGPGVAAPASLAGTATPPQVDTEAGAEAEARWRRADAQGTLAALERSRGTLPVRLRVLRGRASLAVLARSDLTSDLGEIEADLAAPGEAEPCDRAALRLERDRRALEGLASTIEGRAYTEDLKPSLDALPPAWRGLVGRAQALSDGPAGDGLRARAQAAVGRAIVVYWSCGFRKAEDAAGGVDGDSIARDLARGRALHAPPPVELLAAERWLEYERMNNDDRTRLGPAPDVTGASPFLCALVDISIGGVRRRVPTTFGDDAGLERASRSFDLLAVTMIRDGKALVRPFARELGRSFRRRAWRRARATGGLDAAAQADLTRALRGVPDVLEPRREELVEPPITLLLAGRVDDARTALEVAPLRQAWERELLLAECDLVEGRAQAASVRLEALLARSGAPGGREAPAGYADVHVALAHAYALLGHTGHRDAQLALAERCTDAVGVDWHDLPDGRDVVLGVGWWPGRR